MDLLLHNKVRFGHNDVPNSGFQIHIQSMIFHNNATWTVQGIYPWCPVIKTRCLCGIWYAIKLLTPYRIHCNRDRKTVRTRMLKCWILTKLIFLKPMACTLYLAFEMQFLHESVWLNWKFDMICIIVIQYCLTLWHRDAIRRHRSGSTSAQSNDWLPDGTLPEPMFTYHQLGRVAFTWWQYSLEMLTMSLTKRCLKITHLKSQPHLLGGNELKDEK